MSTTYLVEVDDWLPEVVLLLVEVSHTDLSEVTWMVFIHVGSVVVLTTSKTTTTRVLAVLSYTTLSGGDVTAAEVVLVYCSSNAHGHVGFISNRLRRVDENPAPCNRGAINSK